MTEEQRTQGFLHLDFACAATGATEIVGRQQRFPLHMTSALRLDPASPEIAFVYLQNPSGGVFEDDHLAIDLCLRENARVHATTPSATKVFGAREGGSGWQRVTIDMKAGSYLEYIPDPIIPLKDASFEQHTQVRMVAGASAILSEVVACGRYARGEEFAYSRLHFRTTVEVDGVQVCKDAFELLPKVMSLGKPGLFAEQRFVVTVLALCPGRPLDGLDRRLDTAAESVPDARSAASALPKNAGVIFRGLAPTPSASKLLVNLVWAEARRTFIGRPLPPIRK